MKIKNNIKKETKNKENIKEYKEKNEIQRKINKTNKE